VRFYELHQEVTRFQTKEDRPEQTMTSPICPPLTFQTAVRKARAAEDTWNSRDPELVAHAYTEDSRWRNRAEFFTGRAAIIEFLRRKWTRELDYRLIKALWTFGANRVSVRFHTNGMMTREIGFRSYRNEQWEFAEDGLMCRREASINDVSIKESDRKFFWRSPGARPSDHPRLSELGL
jgi:nuclear transport factor 2 (NTF2) superfamily protein